jgi:hypothetical protein
MSNAERATYALIIKADNATVTLPLFDGEIFLKPNLSLILATKILETAFGFQQQDNKTR